MVAKRPVSKGLLMVAIGVFCCIYLLSIICVGVTYSTGVQGATILHCALF